MYDLHSLRFYPFAEALKMMTDGNWMMVHGEPIAIAKINGTWMKRKPCANNLNRFSEKEVYAGTIWLSMENTEKLWVAVP